MATVARVTTITVRSETSFEDAVAAGVAVALGCSLFLTLQALVNMLVVTGMLPTKGIALPFISYGGTNLVVSGILIGLMLNALRDGGRPAVRAAIQA